MVFAGSVVVDPCFVTCDNVVKKKTVPFRSKTVAKDVDLPPCASAWTDFVELAQTFRYCKMPIVNIGLIQQKSSFAPATEREQKSDKPAQLSAISLC